MIQGFEYENQFNTDNAFTNIKFGYDRPVLETELNELQEIQNHNRKSLMQKICKSGIVELVDRDFTGDKIVYNPNMERNKIAIAPMRVNVTGYELHVCGDYQIDEIKTYLDIDLGNAPSGNDNNSIYRNDLVFLQVWFEEISADSEVKRYGNTDGPSIPNSLIDNRVGEETSHRVGIRWKIRVAQYVDFNTWPDGFGFNNNSTGGYSSIKTDIVNGINIIDTNTDAVFANATHYMFKGCSFYGDNNLWVAGRPDVDDPTNTKDSKFVFAIPLFKITRRNQQMYSLLNPNGSTDFNNRDINLRPDGKAYDMIYESDLLDLRKNVIINDNDANYYLDNTLNKIFDGTLTTKSGQKMRRIQFGIKPLDKSASNLLFLDSFDPSQIPTLGNAPIIEKRATNTIVNYVPSVTKWGLSVDGNIRFTYNTTNLNPNEGTVDFFILPEWNGFDSINQFLFGLYQPFAGSVSPFITVNKSGNKFTINRYADTSNNPHISSMNINTNKILANKIYHIRICWSVVNNKFECYINGKLAGNSLDPYIPIATFTSISRLQLGNIETATSTNMGFVIDELAIYNKYMGDTTWSIPKDYINGDALILPSFNGTFRNYRDNNYEQKYMVNHILPIVNSTTFSMTAPYKTLFGSTPPKVYCLSTTSLTPSTVVQGTEIVGTWTGLNTSSLQFTLNTSAIAAFTKFSGETFAIIYSVIIPGGNNVDDVPNELLRSEYNDLTDGSTHEVSFNIENNTGVINTPREVPTLINTQYNVDGSVTYTGRRYLYDIHDSAYDFSTFRNSTNDDFAFARLLDYYVDGNQTNLYTIPVTVYGYDVLYIRDAYQIHNTISRTQEIIPLNILSVERKESPSNPAISIYNITLQNVIYSGDKIKFELGLGGLTFDYNNNSKAFVGNISSAEYLEFTTTGNMFDYFIPVNNVSNIGSCTKGPIFSLGTQYSHKFDASGNEIIDPTYQGEYICFRNNKTYKYTYLDGIGKPYLKIHISQLDVYGNELKLPAGEKIQIPIFISKQPASTDILSVWYNYIPYQGTLTNSPRKLKRLSDWKYFITTLSSGNTNDKNNSAYSLNNIINHLPGGAMSSSAIVGQDILLTNHGLSSFEKIDNYTVNKKLIFINQHYLGTINDNIDANFFELETDYTVSKKFGNIQDDKIIINTSDYKVYFSTCDNPINKYCGMACVVADEYGDLYVLLIGDTNSTIPSISNSISPDYGDLFAIPYRPSLINRK